MLDYEKLMNYPVPEAEHRYTERDAILYALGCGYGLDPADEKQLRFVYEEDLHVAPTMAAVLATPGFWLKNPDTGVDWKRVLHGSQAMTIHQPLRPADDLIGRTRIVDIVDKGPKVGAILFSERTVVRRGTDEPVCTLNMVTVCRGDGGFGGGKGKSMPKRQAPDRDPDMVETLRTSPQAALIYRLSGDPNPLHADPAVARAAGFERPILHGLATFGVAGHALVRACCGYRGEGLKHMEVRFTAPVLPGETIETAIWRDGDGAAHFRCRVPDRDTVVIDGGYAEFTG